MPDETPTDQQPANLQAAPKQRPLFVKILVVILLVVGAFAAYIANLPDDYHIERSTTIVAAPEAVFEQVDDFHKWDAWSPWAKLDPNAKNRFEGPDSGQGAIFKWAGNDQVGEGSMTIRGSHPSERIRIQLDFEKPMQDTSTVEFTFEPQGDQTKVTWSMEGHYPNLFGKAMCKLMNMDRMIGSKFEEGLASLKKVVETTK